MAFSIPSIPAVVLGTSATVVYQVADTVGKNFITKNIALCNTTTSPVTVTMYRAPSAGTTTDATAFIKDLPIAAKTTVFIEEEFTLGQNESIRGLCSATSSVTVTLSGAGEI